MAFEQMDWQRLLSRIRAGTCTPFIGAGACGGHLPSGRQLSIALADEHSYAFSEGAGDLA